MPTKPVVNARHPRKQVAPKSPPYDELIGFTCAREPQSRDPEEKAKLACGVFHGDLRSALLCHATFARDAFTEAKLSRSYLKLCDEGQMQWTPPTRIIHTTWSRRAGLQVWGLLGLEMIEDLWRSWVDSADVVEPRLLPAQLTYMFDGERHILPDYHRIDWQGLIDLCKASIAAYPCAK